MDIQIKCDYCEESFYRSVSEVNQNCKRNHKNYCSDKCKTLSKVTGQQLSCKYCEKPVYRNRAAISKNVSGEFFCNKSCRMKYRNSFSIGENHPNFKHGSNSTYYRKLAFETYGKQCRICGYNIECVLEVHHIDGNRENNNTENLDVLCPTHHTEYEFGIR